MICAALGYSSNSLSQFVKKNHSIDLELLLNYSSTGRDDPRRVWGLEQSSLCEGMETSKELSNPLGRQVG